MRWKIFYFLFALVPYGCGKIKPVPNHNFLNMDSLLTAQGKRLARVGATLEKTVSLNDSIEHRIFHFDSSSEWQREFRIFQAITDLNKASYRNDYVSADTTDDASNLRMEDISSPGLPLRSVKIYSMPNGPLRRIEAIYVERRPMLRRKELLKLYFDQVNDSVMLVGYEVNGGQRILLGDTLTYHLEATVNHTP